ncbi:Amidase signature domain protein [Cordyceps fumosorosea ARSEF 2679]|uniref:Amidase signature domain protein n=1 Tax=Cordyceps fumosorosea (strain ARSEF 2679) TaxID=1081104 RepID=A0A167Q193_CORFA|nr:Amidase signature domain protein [Cordyceps fumosorosea ARSEF 2679]OAA57192.1 Amidase signature domain protein [Cordyceps fumosorosea ARSEF 2679]
MKPLFTAVIAGVNYLLHPDVLGMIQEDINPDAVLPVTLISTEELNSPNLDAFLKGLELYDDVYSSEFAFALVEKPGANETTRSRSKRTADVPGRQTFTVQVTDTRPDEAAKPSPFSTLPTGPYILHGKELHQAYRIYEDELGAFSAGLVPEKHNSSDQFVDLGDRLPNGTYRSVAVPSRLYFPGPSIRKPLSGLRYAVPEDFDVRGLPTTLSSHNWTALHPNAAAQHAAHVQLLLDHGAVLVGKTKDAQFAAGTSWIDVAPPLNPRGDGKQPPGGAAAGALSALSNYTWLGNSISQGALDGTLSQAAAYGLFALRATARTVSQRGVRTSSPKLQSTGLSGRSLEDLVHLIAPSLKLNRQATQPRRIIYPTDFAQWLSAKQRALMDEFLVAWEKTLGVKAERMSLADVWAKSLPNGADNQTLHDYLGNAAYYAFCYDFYHNYDDFRSAFKAKFGQAPYTEPNVAEQWSVGAKTDGRAAKKKLEVFTTWFSSNVASAANGAPEKAAVIVPVLAQNDMKYNPSKGLHPNILAPVLGRPQMSAPFAQIAMEGDGNSYVPFSASVMGAKGDDIMLVQIMKRAFDIADWRVRVDPGRLTFPVGNNSRGVDDHHQDPYPPPITGGISFVVDDREL